jgi:hypothetical protein
MDYNYNYPRDNANRYMAFKINNEWKFMFANEYTSHSEMFREVDSDSETQIELKFGGFFTLATANASKSIKQAFRKEELERKRDKCTEAEDDELWNMDTSHPSVIMLFGISDSYSIYDKEMFEEAIDSLRNSLGNNKKLIVIDEFDDLK